ncbi:hypothetical protein [Flavobacterium suncheonense]|uniref:Uncharacterized protein n=1 Tax=Flavobacterium suncheonense GH29-5 = DSM 17707 TaxID=1121899 RepID=A0A0A2MM81_9FLAO|nr:hypothetical protein [Flavobacterium suncheonense]KGO89400.1 hypothetical protein Q764_08455 [Flavobacterium suncheonense GH29-5 = DSM 17707]
MKTVGSVAFMPEMFSPGNKCVGFYTKKWYIYLTEFYSNAYVLDDKAQVFRGISVKDAAEF